MKLKKDFSLGVFGYITLNFDLGDIKFFFGEIDIFLWYVLLKIFLEGLFDGRDEFKNERDDWRDNLSLGELILFLFEKKRLLVGFFSYLLLSKDKGFFELFCKYLFPKKLLRSNFFL